MMPLLIRVGCLLASEAMTATAASAAGSVGTMIFLTGWQTGPGWRSSSRCAPGWRRCRATGAYTAPPRRSKRSTSTRQRPALPEVDGLLAEPWIRSSLRPTPKDLTNVQEEPRLFPVLPGIVGRVALLLTINGRADQALTGTDLSLARAAERPRRQAFQTTGRRLEGLAASP